MSSSSRTRPVGVLTALALLVSSLVALVAAVPTATAETNPLPAGLAINATPTTNLVDGDTVTVTADASLGQTINAMDVRLCKGSAVINNLADFNPTQGGNCITAALSPVSDFRKSVATAPPNLQAVVTFKVGVGSNSFTSQNNGPVTITCGPSDPCKLTARLQMPAVAGGNVYTSFPLTYASATVPATLAAPTGTAGNAKATVSWAAASNGNSPVTGYTVKTFQNGVLQAQTCTWTSGPLTCEVTGLTNGLPYTFKVVATNGVGTSLDSPASGPVTPTQPPSPPDAPTGVTATAGNATATVSWTAPLNNGGSAITGYTVKAFQGGVLQAQTCSTGGALTCDVPGLTNGLPYTFKVFATNGNGPGPDSVASSPVTPATVPGAPTGVSGTAGNTKVTVSWTAPASNGGSAITGYTVKTFQGGVLQAQTCSTGGALTCEVTGLTNGTAYTFKVFATNAKGPGPDSAASPPVTPVVGDLFHPLAAPTRILDSRPAPETVGPYATPWGAGTIREVPVAGVGGVPVGATAVTLNVTVTGTTAASFLTLWPKGASQPTASNLNWTAGQTIPNAVTVKVGTDGKIDVFNPSGNVNVIIDVVGYYDQSGTGAGFTSQAPVRVLDSRPAPETVGPYATPWAAGTDREVTVTGGTTGVPVDAEAVVANVTVTGTSAESFLTVYPNGAAKPTASSLNWKAGVTIPNAVTVKVGTGGKIRVFNNSGSANVIIDVVGFFKTGAGDAFHPVAPVRFADSRPAPETVGAYATPWGAGTERTVSVLTGGAVPAGAKAVLANFTVTSTSAESFATVWNTGATKPTASSLNWKAGVTIANAVTAKVGTGDTISVFNNSGTVNVIADAAGWYG